MKTCIFLIALILIVINPHTCWLAGDKVKSQTLNWIKFNLYRMIQFLIANRFLWQKFTPSKLAGSIYKWVAWSAIDPLKLLLQLNHCKCIIVFSLMVAAESSQTFFFFGRSSQTNWLRSIQSVPGAKRCSRMCLNRITFCSRIYCILPKLYPKCISNWSRKYTVK